LAGALQIDQHPRHLAALDPICDAPGGAVWVPAGFAITCLAIALRAYRYNRSPWPIALAVVFMPTLWVFFMGNVDGLVLAGLMVLPWGIPLVLMKPQVSAFALLARRRWLLAGIVWTLISVAPIGW
jgi:hypothetical protein